MTGRGGGGGPTSSGTKRLRWATQRVPGPDAGRKRDTIMRALSMKKYPEKGEADLEGTGQNFGGMGPGPEDEDEEDTQRRIFVNMPLPPECIDEDGSPKQWFSRNKIRTAKYTPLIFVPKNLWLQFHNVANVYFLFVTILAVRQVLCALYSQKRLTLLRLDFPHFRCLKSSFRIGAFDCYLVDHCY